MRGLRTKVDPKPSKSAKARAKAASGQNKSGKLGKSRSRSVSLPTLRRKAWGLFSKYIRQRDAGGYGHLLCCCCGSAVRTEDAHAAHFIHCSRQSFLSYDERNIHGCCVKCNVYLHGNLIEYTLFMQQKYGQDVIDELRQMKHSKLYLLRSDLEAIIEKYREYA
jgi:hypothetical protein